jgi:PAS domain S-box-containing protein
MERRVERATRAKETYAWIASTPTPVVITDEDGRVLALNAAFEVLVAVSPAFEEPVEDLIIASRYRAAYRAARRLALSPGSSLVAEPPSEFALVRADGGEFTAQLSFAQTSEAPLHLATWIRDLTKDRTVLTQTPRRKLLSEHTEELAGIGSWEWTPESGRLRWSDNLFRICGLRPREITPSLEYVLANCHPDDKELLERVTTERGQGGRYPEVRYRYVWPDGTVRHLTSTVVSAAPAGGRKRTVIGTVQDVTEQHRTQLELAARFAVSDALAGWEAGVRGARRLVRDLAEALEFDFGAMWTPRDDFLAVWAVWQAHRLYSHQRELDLGDVHLRRGEGLTGSAWASARPAKVSDLTDDAFARALALNDQSGLYVALALPATYGDEVLAVLTFASRRQAVLTDQFMHSLLGIGDEIGHFLARRRGELSAPALSARELQVIQLSATGYARRQIAEEIGLSEATIKTHMEHIYKKLGVPDRASAVAEVLRQGLIH